MTSEEFLKKIQNCESYAEAQMLSGLIFSSDSSTTDKTFKPSIPVDWKIFYDLIDMENRFGLSHWGSAYAFMHIGMPRIQAVWNNKDTEMSSSDIDDYKQQLFYDLPGYIDKWDRDRNDNFLAFINNELSTTANKVAKPEINDYIRKTRGYSMSSLDQLREATENSNGYDPEDPNVNVEESAIDLYESRGKSLLNNMITIEDEDNVITGSKTQSKNAIFAQKLLGGISGFENDMIDAVEEFMEL